MTCKFKNIWYFFLTLASCSNNNLDVSISDSSQFNIQVKKNDSIVVKTFDTLFNKIEILYLKTPDSVFISTVSKLICYKEKFLILDKKFSSVTCFDSSGNFLLQYGKIGLNNNEYESIQDFDIDYATNQLIIFSNENQSLYYYSLNDGLFLKKKYIGLYANSFNLLPDNHLIFYVDYKVNKKMPGFNVLIADSDGQVLKRCLPFNPNLSSIGWALSTGFLNKSDSQFFFSDAFNDSVFCYNDGKVFLFAYIDINSDIIQKNKLDHQTLLHSGIVLNSSSSFLKNHFFANKNYVAFNYQFDKRVKTAIYNKKNKGLNTLTAKNATDPLLILAHHPLFLDNNDNLTFAISPDDILKMKKEEQSLYKKLPIEIKSCIQNTDSISNFYLLTAHLKD